MMLDETASRDRGAEPDLLPADGQVPRCRHDAIHLHRIGQAGTHQHRVRVDRRSRDRDRLSLSGHQAGRDPQLESGGRGQVPGLEPVCGIGLRG